MSVALTISPANPADGPILGAIMLRAMEPHMIDRFFVPEEDFAAAYDAKMKWYLSEYAVSIKDPARRIFKGTIPATGEVVALGAIKYHDGDFGAGPGAEASGEKGMIEDDVVVEDLVPVSKDLPAEKKLGFAQYYFGKVEGVHRKHLSGVKHVVWTTLMVKTEWQGKGIGGAMLKWGFNEFRLEKEVVWLGTQMRGRNIYRRYGWEDVEHFDVDLSVWGGKLRGFGIHRTPLMIRRPGELKKIEGIVDE